MIRWPRGIDVIGVIWRKALRHYTVGRDLFGDLAIDDRDVAMAKYITSRAYPDGSKREARLRLARLHVRRFRRELIEQKLFLESAARGALMALGCPPSK
jgi:hypothetical protein